MFNRIIYFPHKLGQRKNGVELAPLIMKHFFNKELASFELEDSNDLFCNLQNLYKVNQSFKGKRVNIGGDHSMSIATVAHTFNNFPKSKILWVDAHADINTYHSSISKNYHGMPLGFLTGLCKSDNFENIKNYVPFENILYFGVRDLDSFEKFIIRELNIDVVTMEDINKDFNRCIGRVLDFVKDDNLHLSFDVDSMDPTVIPSTGTPVKGGLSLEEGKSLLDVLLKKSDIYNVDITELNLNIGNTKDKVKSLHNTFSLFENYFE